MLLMTIGNRYEDTGVESSGIAFIQNIVEIDQMIERVKRKETEVYNPVNLLLMINK
jgi:hypothetical protein